MTTIGILALQGNFAQHRALLRTIYLETLETPQQVLPSRVDVKYVRSEAELLPCHGLIIPGGESTTMRNLLHKASLFSLLRTAGKRGFPLFGVCAGVILLATRIRGADEESLGILDVEVERNGYGRQIHSFEAEVDFRYPATHGNEELVKRAPVTDKLSNTSMPPIVGKTDAEVISSTISGTFIRAPIIHSYADTVEVLARHNATPVVVRDGSTLGSTCHPEVKRDSTLHRLFLTECVDHTKVCADYLHRVNS